MKYIGKYEVLSELGRGGMGVVYRAEDKNIGREVAIKTLTAASSELRQRFMVEARSGVLSHPNIVTVYDFGDLDGVPYIVMEYLQGESLDKVLRRTKPLSMVQKLEIVRQVCEGLSYAHSKGVVHRDIKPGNIMVLQGDAQIKIFDFGIARLKNSGGETKTGAIIGTFHYISPERLKGDMSDGRADIWAAGVMLYQMLTGVLPFAGEDFSALHKVVNEPFLPISHYLEDYPAELDKVLERSLAKRPDDRYRSAEQMASDLEAINSVLKPAHMQDLLAHVRDLLHNNDLDAARLILLDLQRVDTQNDEIKKLLREVQELLTRQQLDRHHNDSYDFLDDQKLEGTRARRATSADGEHEDKAGSFTQLFQSLESDSSAPKSGTSRTIFSEDHVNVSKVSFFDATNVSRTSFFEGDHVRYTKIQETLEFYRDHLTGEYRALSNQAKLTYYLWIASVVLGLASLVSGIVLLFFRQFAAGSITTISTAFVYFVQKIFQQREDHYRSLATAKHEHLEDGNRWLLAIQTIDSIENSGERLRRQGQLADILNKKLAPSAMKQSRTSRKVTAKPKSANK